MQHCRLVISFSFLLKCRLVILDQFLAVFLLSILRAHLFSKQLIFQLIDVFGTLTDSIQWKFGTYVCRMRVSTIIHCRKNALRRMNIFLFCTKIVLRLRESMTRNKDQNTMSSPFDNLRILQG